MRERFKRLSPEKQLYTYGLIGIAICVALSPFILWFFRNYKLPCIFLTLTGFYCPGCGGTRAVHSLASGHILRSLWYHPFVLYSVTLFGVYMLSHTLSIISRGRIKGMKFRNAYLYIAIGIILVNFILKNILLKTYGIVLN